MKFLRAAGSLFYAIPGWLKLVIGAAVWILFYLDEIPNALRWPARFFIPAILFFGLSQSLWKMDGRPWHEWLWRPFLNPIPIIAAFMWFSYQVKESFPLSHYPMYSDPGPERVYMYVAGVSGEAIVEPLPIYDLTRITVFKVRRMYRTYRDKFRKPRELSLEDLTYDHKRIYGEQVLEFLQGEATRHGTAPAAGVPNEWGLVEVTVTYDEEAKKVNEDEKVIATRSLK